MSVVSSRNSHYVSEINSDRSPNENINAIFLRKSVQKKDITIMNVNIDFAGRKVEVGAPFGAFWVDLAIALSFGLLFATVLTLLLTPCMLALRVKYSKKYRESNLKPLSGNFEMQTAE